MKLKQGEMSISTEGLFRKRNMLQDIRILLVEAEEAIQKLVSVKARIAAELARQVAEAPGKTIGAKKRKVLSGLGQEERKTVTDLDQHFREKIFGDPEKPKPKKKAPEPDTEQEEPEDEALVLTTKRARASSGSSTCASRSRTSGRST